MAKVSIIIPIYNVENYMIKSVGSVINQTEKDIEIILVDDGSTDSSGQVCDKFASQDNRIKVVHKKNGGLSSARNAGVNVATSEYILLLDGDDYLREDAIEKLLRVAEDYPSDFIQFRYCEVFEEKEPIVKINNKEVYQVYSSKELFDNLYNLGGVAASGCTKLYRKDLLVKIPFENIQHEDEMWCTRAFVTPLTATYISDELYFYVMRGDSIIHSRFNPRKLDVFKVLEERINVLQKLNFTDFICFEYTRMFTQIVRLYCDAKKVDDIDSLAIIKKQFIENKNRIIRYVNKKSRFYVLLIMMCINYKAVEIYRMYVNKRFG